MPIMPVIDFEAVEIRSEYWGFFLFQIPITTIIVLIVLLKRLTVNLMCRFLCGARTMLMPRAF